MTTNVSAPRAIALGCGLLALMALLVTSCTVAVFTAAGDGSANPSAAGGPAPSPSLTHRTATPTPTAKSVALREDAASLRMCRDASLAVAYRRAGDTARERTHWRDAQAAATRSRVEAVAALAASPSRGRATRMWRWCGESGKAATPRVTAQRTSVRPKPPSRVTKRPTAAPATSRPTRAPKPKPKPAPRTVRPGAFCSPQGASGVSSAGKVYRCMGPGQARWRPVG